jgi:tRNA (guanine37-N1)-methyltransferase
MRFDIVTIFPDFFDGPFRYGVLHRAMESGIVSVGLHDLRAFTHDRHKTVDDRPFGGGEGMVLKPEPIFDAVESLGIAEKPARNPQRETVVLLSAQGERFTQAVAHQLSRTERVVLLCGRYEGVDERVNTLLADRELSIGDYVLSGGELGAAIVVDTVTRLLPGVLGNADSARFESFGHSDAHLSLQAEAAAEVSGVPRSTHGSGGLLDYPHFTRPAEFRGAAVPEVLACGNHEVIRKWRRQQSLLKTLHNRPDLLARAELSDGDREFLAQVEVQKPSAKP